METHREISVLSAFRPFQRLLQAFNFTNFDRARSPYSSEKQHIVCIVHVAVLLITPPVVVTAGIWHLIEDDVTMAEFSTSFALIVAYTQMFSIYISLMMKNRIISETLENIQKSINRRELELEFTSVFVVQTEFLQKVVFLQLNNFVYMQKMHFHQILPIRRLRGLENLISNLRAQRAKPYTAYTSATCFNRYGRRRFICVGFNVSHFVCNFRLSEARQMAASIRDSVSSNGVLEKSPEILELRIYPPTSVVFSFITCSAPS